MKQQSSGFSIAAMVLGIVGLVLGFVIIGFIPSVIGLIFGIIVLSKGQGGKGMAIAGVVCSALGIVISAIVLFVPSSDTVVVETDKTVVEAVAQNQTSIEATETAKAESTAIEESQVDLSSAVTYETIDAENVCMMTFTNNSDKDVEIEVNFVFDNNGSLSDAGYGHLYCLGVGKSGVICMHKPVDENTGLPIAGVTTQYSVTVNEHGLFDSTGSHTDSIVVESSADTDGNVTISATNTSDATIDMVDVYIIFFKDGVPVDYDDYGWVDELTAGYTGYWTFDAPFYSGGDYDRIEYDTYEIYVNNAYNSEY